MDIKILYRHPAFIVIDKPSGISTHPSPGDLAPNVVDLLRDQYYSLHPLSRLDNGTSGLLALGLKPEAVGEIVLLQKSYMAEVFGVAPVSGVIDKELVTKAFGSGIKKRQTALSRFRRVKHNGETSCLLIHIATGRHHQIRKHLRSIGYPVVGDFRHGYKDKNLAYQEKLGTRLRMMLHCYRLCIEYRGKVYRFESPLTRQPI